VNQSLKSNQEVEELKSMGLCFLGGILGIRFNWISASTIKETIVVAVISLIIGYLGNKLLVWADSKISAIIKKIKDKKAS
jgi:hypothetical protein